MANDCLVKTLKGAVNTDLYKLSELRMFLPAGNSIKLQGGTSLVLNSEFTITALSGSFTYDGNTYTTGSTATISATSTRKDLVVPATGDAVISISNKQAIRYFELTGDRVSSVSGKHICILNPEFGYMSNLVEIISYMAYDAKSLGHFPLLTKFGRAHAYQMLSPYVWRNYVNHKNFPAIEMLVFKSSNQTDQVNISVFASLITLTSLRFTSDYGAIGSLESLAQGMVDAGRTSGNLVVYPSDIITYNGEKCSPSKDYTISFTGSSYTITPSA